MAAKKNFTLEMNAGFRKRLRYKAKSGRPINLTGWTAVMQARATPDSEIVLLNLTTENGGISLTASGVVEISIEQSILEALTFDTAAFDLVLFSPGTAIDRDRKRLIEGKLTLSRGVSRISNP